MWQLGDLAGEMMYQGVVISWGVEFPSGQIWESGVRAEIGPKFNSGLDKLRSNAAPGDHQQQASALSKLHIMKRLVIVRERGKWLRIRGVAYYTARFHL